MLKVFHSFFHIPFFYYYFLYFLLKKYEKSIDFLKTICYNGITIKKAMIVKNIKVKVKVYKKMNEKVVFKNTEKPDPIANKEWYKKHAKKLKKVGIEEKDLLNISFVIVK